jgi:uncharacterized membrane protein YeaQ/YmgE (transglycosylase-associated protein family)
MLLAMLLVKSEKRVAPLHTAICTASGEFFSVFLLKKEAILIHPILLFVPGTAWGWIVWIIIGGIAGWLAGLLVRGAGFGILGDIVVGIVGAIIGGIILSALFGVGTGGIFWSFLTAFIGAVILIFVVRLITGGRTRGRTI